MNYSGILWKKTAKKICRYPLTQPDIQPELTASESGELFGDILEEDSEENLPLSFDPAYIQPELTDSEAGELFGNILEEDSAENLRYPLTQPIFSQN